MHPLHPLDNPVWHALTGPQATVAEGTERARRYRSEYSVFAALPDEPDQAAWDDLAELVRDDGTALLAHVPDLPPGWEALRSFPVHQLVVDTHVEFDTTRVEQLGPADLGDLSALIEVVRPGPWAARTHRLGDFFGIRVDGRLVAAAGQRMRLPDHTEISAVSTLPAVRGHGFGTAVTRATADAILAAGAEPFLHVQASNTDAIRIYERLGFTIRRTLDFGLYQPLVR